MAKWEWLPLTEEEQNGPSMEVELEPINPELVELRQQAIESALRNTGMMLAYEEAMQDQGEEINELEGQIETRNSGVREASEVRKGLGNKTTEEVEKALDDKLQLHPAHANSTARAMAKYLKGAIPHRSESTIRKHLHKIYKKRKIKKI